MKIETIQNLLAELNAVASKPKVVKKPVTAPAVKTNGNTALSAEESLELSAKRIADAFGMPAKGVSAEALVARVHFFEGKQQGRVQ